MNNMSRTRRAIWRILMILATVALPLVLLLSSLRTFRDLDRQQAVFLRNRAAAVAGRLETLPAPADEASLFELLSEGEPALVDLELLTRGQPAAERPFLMPLWEGQELFRTETLDAGGTQLFRAWVPFHSNDQMRIARIDLDARAAEFLVSHARHNVALATLSGLVLVALALYAVWATRRAARLEVRQMELEHLAHLGEMSAVLAHEIRNPLGTIKGFAQLIGEQAGEGARDSLNLILDEVRRLERLVGDLLLYGRPPAPVPRLVRWEEILAPVQAHAGQLVSGREIRFTADTPAIQWETDPALLQQALLNLLRNAVEALGERPEGDVRLEVRRPASGGVTLAVIDNGPGIPKEVRARLFRGFFTTKTFGSGLGLSIARRLAQSLDGDLALEDAAGGGTEATLLFPKASPRETGGEKEA